ncbi:hypothetical protein HDU92_005979, partial [Lobulomyces angularis]
MFNDVKGLGLGILKKVNDLSLPTSPSTSMDPTQLQLQLVQELSSTRAKLQQHQTENENLKNLNLTLENKIKQNEEEIVEKNNDLEKIRLKLKFATKDNSKLMGDAEEEILESEEVTILRKRLKEFGETIRDYERRKEEEKERLMKLEEQLREDEIFKTGSDGTAKLVENDIKSTEFDETSNSEMPMTTEAESNSLEVNNVQENTDSQIKFFKQRNEKLIEMLKLNQVEISDLQLSYQSIKKLLDEKNTLLEQTEISRVAEEKLRKEEANIALTKKQEEIEKLQQELENFKKENDHLAKKFEQELALKENTIETLQEKVNQGIKVESEELETLKKENTSLSELLNEVTQLKKTDSETSITLKNNVEDLNKSLLAFEQKNFTLEEQVQDLRIQVSNKTAEISNLKESLNCKIAETEKQQKENDDKIRKMKGILSQANKNISENKALVATLEQQLSEANNKIANYVLEESRSQNNAEEHTNVIESLSSELYNLKMDKVSELESLQKQLNQSQAETQEIKAEFNSYKIKAQFALSKSNSTSYEIRIKDLEELSQKLNQENSLKIAEVEQSHSKIKSLLNDCAEKDEMIEQLEVNLVRFQMDLKEVDLIKFELSDVKKKLETETERHTKVLLEKENEFNASLQALKDDLKSCLLEAETKVKLKEEENAGLHHICEGLGLEISQLRNELENTRSDLVVCKNSLLKSTESLNSVSNINNNFKSRDSESQLDSPVSSNRDSFVFDRLQYEQQQLRIQELEKETQENKISTMKEKELQLKIKHLTELLNESEANSERYNEQEK